jgi:hypothetical protein
MDFTQYSWILQFAIPSASALLVMLFAKFCPKEKGNTVAINIGNKIGTIISKFLTIRIGKKAAEAVEEGIIATLLSWIGRGFIAIHDSMLVDNIKENKDAK